MSYYFSFSLSIVIVINSILYILLIFDQGDLEVVGEESILLRCLFTLKSFYLLNLIIEIIMGVLFFIDLRNIDESKYAINTQIFIFFVIPMLSSISVLFIMNDFKNKIDKIAYSFFVILHPIMLVSICLYSYPILLENKITFSLYVVLFILTTYQISHCKDIFEYICGTKETSNEEK